MYSISNVEQLDWTLIRFIKKINLTWSHMKVIQVVQKTTFLMYLERVNGYPAFTYWINNLSKIGVDLMFYMTYFAILSIS